MGKTKFKPCPFCGSENVDRTTCDVSWVTKDARGKIHTVGCVDCGAIITPFSEKWKGEKWAKMMAARAWNRRTK